MDDSRKSSGKLNSKLDKLKETEASFSGDEVKMDEAKALEHTLIELALVIDQTAASLLEALARFDELEGWRQSGASHCAGWMTLKLGMSFSLAWEKLRVARALRKLPIIRQLFAEGSLTWSKVRALSRVATTGTEQALGEVAQTLSVSAVVSLCENLRLRDPNGGRDEAALDRLRLERRSLTWSDMTDGNTLFRLVLPPEMAANFRRCLERAEDRLFESADAVAASSASVAFNEAHDAATTSRKPAIIKPSAVQRRADAAVAMGESSLSAEGIGVASADRYQVIVHVDADALDMALQETGTPFHSNPAVDATLPPPDDVACHESEAIITESCVDQGTTPLSADRSDSVIPQRRTLEKPNPHVRVPTPITPRAACADLASDDHNSAGPVQLPLAIRIALQGGRGVSAASVQRLVCDASLVTQIESDGIPVSIGRKSRIWPDSIRRACMVRDGGTCSWPGCHSTRWLDVHHMTHWLLGGETSVENGVVLCRGCHTRVHAEGWQIERIASSIRSDASRKACLQSQPSDQANSRETEELIGALNKHVTQYRFTRQDPLSGDNLSVNSDSSSDDTYPRHEQCCSDERGVYSIPLSHHVEITSGVQGVVQTTRQQSEEYRRHRTAKKSGILRVHSTRVDSNHSNRNTLPGNPVRVATSLLENHPVATCRQRPVSAYE